MLLRNKILNKKLLKSLILLATVLLAACQSMNARLGMDSSDHSNLKELPKLQLPAGSLAESERYAIPKIKSKSEVIITKAVPPDYN